jgi:hypothetical protein
MSIRKVVKQLTEARREAEKQVEQIAQAIRILSHGKGRELATAQKAPAARRLSATARRRISLGMKARWARFRKQKESNLQLHQGGRKQKRAA